MIDMWEFLQKPLILGIARWIVGLVFFVAGMRKLKYHKRFISAVLAYRVLPKRMAIHFAHALPWLEISVGLMLLLGVLTRLASALSAALLVSFMVAMGTNFWRGRTDLECGCSGSGHHPIRGTLLLRNALLLLLALQIAFFDDESIGIHRTVLMTPIGLLQEALSTSSYLPLLLATIDLWITGWLLRHLIHLLRGRRTR